MKFMFDYLSVGGDANRSKGNCFGFFRALSRLNKNYVDHPADNGDVAVTGSPIPTPA